MRTKQNKIQDLNEVSVSLSGPADSTCSVFIAVYSLTVSSPCCS